MSNARPTAEFQLQAYLEIRNRQVDEALQQFLPAGLNAPAILTEAMRYNAFTGGKRFRPILTMAAAEAVGGDAQRVLPTACAVELIHGFSLVHDDLPCMDDDDVRRGMPTLHKRFGEAVALLAGDALLIYAFRLMADNAGIPGVDPAACLQVIRELADAAGFPGMVGGQILDITITPDRINGESVNGIHRAKTGALIRGSVRAGALLAGAPAEALQALTAYAENLGLTYQIVDDLLDADKDEPASFPAVYGVEESRRRVQSATEAARAALGPLGPAAEPLRALATFLQSRAA